MAGAPRGRKVCCYRDNSSAFQNRRRFAATGITIVESLAENCHVERVGSKIRMAKSQTQYIIQPAKVMRSVQRNVLLADMQFSLCLAGYGLPTPTLVYGGLILIQVKM